MGKATVQQVRDEGSAADLQKRRYQRRDVADFVGYIVDGKKMVSGVVGNLSTGGFSMSNLPSSFNPERFVYSAVLAGETDSYKMLAKPCWWRPRGNRRVDIGFKILDAQWNWLKLTMQDLPAPLEVKEG